MKRLLRKVFTKVKEFFKKVISKNKVNKFTLYIGLNDKDTRKQEVSIEEGKEVISTIFAKNGIEGATFLDAKGIYTYVSGDTEEENSFKIEVLFSTKKQIKRTIEEIKQQLNQESVALVQEKIRSSLI